MKKIKLLSLFSGIGAPEQALKNIGIKYELIGFSEIDKFAVKSYCNVHNVSEDLNLGDITKIDISSLPTDIDLITHGSPCQDFSVAGENKGGDKGTGTRSSLMWNTVDIVEHCKPKVVIWENVKNLLSKRHRHNFDAYLEIMEQLGYNNYYQVLNAKDYGIPQNRERIFTVSIRKDVDEGYVFPEPQELTLRLKDMLEDEVDEKYNISTCKIQQLFENVGGKLDLSKQVIETCHKNNDIQRSTRDRVYNAEKNAPTLNATMYKDAIKVLIPIDDKNSRMDNVTMVNDNYGMINGGTIGKMHDSSRRCYSVDYVSPTINTCGGGNLEPKIIEPIKTDKIITVGNYSPSNHNASRIVDANGISPTVMENHGTVTGVLVPLLTETDEGYKVRVANKQGYQIAMEGDGIDLEQPNSKIRRGRVQKQSVGTLNTAPNKAVVDQYRVRKLTPRECWRLMGFTDEQFDKAAKECSNTQLYKQAGNSIVVNVLEEIIDNLKKIL